MAQFVTDADPIIVVPPYLTPDNGQDDGEH
jgi:hypothetical protein